MPTRLARLRFRAWHRGTREADYIFGCFFDTQHQGWDEADLDWFEDLLEVDDVYVLDWAFRKDDPPARFQGPMMDAFQRLDFVDIPR